MAFERGAHDHAEPEGERAGRRHLAAAVAGSHLDGRGIRVAGIHGHRLAVDPLRVVARHVHHVGLCGLDGDELRRRLDHGGAGIDRLQVCRRRVVLRCRGARDAQLVVVLESARRRCALAHDLDGVHHVGRIVVVGLAECLGPRDVAGHLVQHRAECGERLDARIPRLLVGRVSERTALERSVLREPAMRGGDLVRIGGAGQDLRHQLVGIQRDGSDELVELLGRRRRVGCRCWSGRCGRRCRCGRGYNGR